MKHIAFCSFGKDSLAQIIEIKRLGLPLDEVVCCRIWFNDEIPGEHPLQVQFIEKATEILKREFNIDVTFIQSNWTFVSHFYRVKRKGKHVGYNYGFPFIKGAWCVDRLKQEVINKYLRKFRGEQVIQYVGIAADEPERIKNLPNVRYILNELNLTENDCFEICMKYDLLSPKYKKSFRDGCWFCPKQSLSSLYDLWQEYPELFNKLKELQPHSFNTFKIGQSIFDIENRFISGYVPRRKLRGAK